MNVRNIEIIEPINNKKGDLFGRLMKDLFHSLGYGRTRLEIHKSGREIDIEAEHRTEKRYAIAECKAQKQKAGGGDLNKFIGSLDVERKKKKKDLPDSELVVQGYFISLSGFTETAIEQEKDAGNSRVILLEAEEVIDELIKGRVIIGLEEAVDSVKSITKGLKLMNDADLVAFEKGWVWVLYYTDNQQISTHYVLVHADGRPLVSKLAEELKIKDQECDNHFKGLELLTEPDTKEVKADRLDQAKQKYYHYLENELGEIQFEGLPTDKEIGSKKVKLENVFVPLHFKLVKPNGQKFISEESEDREGISELLEKSTKLVSCKVCNVGKRLYLKRNCHDLLPRHSYRTRTIPA